MNASDFLADTLRPTLHEIGMYSPSAEKLLLMTACHESAGFKYRRQVGGPALSFFQMEPNTLTDLYDNYLSYRPDRLAMLDQYRPLPLSHTEALERIDAYACAAARLQYSRVKEPLPEASDDWGMAEYCKEHWNTTAGKATPQKYYDDWLRYKPEGYE